ncbi:MAG: hypothetical protein ABH859_06660 [Pseudomonadota bacterium]
MKARRVSAATTRSSMRMGYGAMLPLNFLKNPFQGGTKMVSAGIKQMKKGAGIYFRMRF